MFVFNHHPSPLYLQIRLQELISLWLDAQFSWGYVALHGNKVRGRLFNTRASMCGSMCGKNSRTKNPNRIYIILYCDLLLLVVFDITHDGNTLSLTWFSTLLRTKVYFCVGTFNNVCQCAHLCPPKAAVEIPLPCFRQDFLTYSTYHMVDQHVVFGGTRWGGSFWHHNLEAPMTVQDMTRLAPDSQFLSLFLCC